MGTRNAETSQGDCCVLPRDGGPRDGGSSSAPPIDQTRSRAGNTVFKSGPLFISSKGIGWTSWKKRWFILTRTSLVFFRSDPSVIPQKGSDVNLTLGGIDLNSSGSVVVKEDKKLLTVLFPDGRDGRAFTLKAETSEDLHDWKAALENALGQAPSAALVMGQNGIFRNEPTEPTETVDGGFEKWTDKQPAKSLVIGRPILLALEDIDGSPSFLEKALTFIEEHGVKTEGILRQAADVDDVNRRVREYEEGKDEFSSEEDAHVIADCVKHVLRALPSYPVPATCCKALLEACRAERGNRINAMRSAIAETFPEPNRRLLQRILQMMQIVASHKAENRMSSSAVSACMAPLLLRPLLSGDCDLENDFNMGGDGSVQLLQAAAAANHAQAIVITLLEEYDNIFGDYTLQEGSVSELYSDTEESGSEDDELTDEDDEIVEDDEILQDDEDSCNQHNPDDETEDEGLYSGTITESYCTSDDEYDKKLPEESGSELDSTEGGKGGNKQQTKSGEIQTSSSQKDDIQSNVNMQSRSYTSSEVQTTESRESIDVSASTNQPHEDTDQSLSSPDTKSTCDSNENFRSRKNRNLLGRTSARKNLSMGSVKRGNEDMDEIQKLELTKSDLQSKISREVKKNAVLRASLEDRKNELHARRVALEQDVEGLQAQLQRERDLRLTIEARLNHPTTLSTISPTIDDKTKADLEEMSQAEEDVVKLKKKVADLHMQLNQQSKNIYGSVCGSCGQPQRANHVEQQNDGEEDIDTEITTLPLEKSRKSEDDDTNNTRDEPQSSSNKQSETKSKDPKITKSGSSNSRKSSTKIEGSVATSSALSKLTTRLHFLKERRTQIVNELQNIENSRSGGGSSSETQMLGTPSRMNTR